MTEQTDLQTEKKAVQEKKHDDPVMRPNVDICEDAAGITLLADMPGVPKEKLDIQVDKDTLSIAGEASLDMPKEMEALYADISTTKYQRSFSLSSELDPGKIKASLKDGILTLHIPKREEHKPRKIEIRVS